MVTTRLMTATELLALPEDEARLELIHGEPNTMSPTGLRHMVLVSRIADALNQHVRAHPGPLVLHGEGGFVLARNPDTILVPDLSVLSEEQARGLDLESDTFVAVAPAIVVEVKSKSDREADIARKLAVYLQAGVPLVWWVRPEERTVTEHRPDQSPRFLGVADALTCEDVLPGFRLEIARLFG